MGAYPHQPACPGANEVHLWFADLDGEEPGRFLPCLSPDELGRARKYHFQKDRDRFILRRGILRTLLAGYTGIAAQELRFGEGKNGKPLLSSAALREPVSFSLSCSGNAALFAFARGHEVGVDLEQERSIPEMSEIARRFFSPAERSAFRALRQDELTQAFFSYWTAKEAFVKATGEGLSRPLDTFDVAPAPGGAASFIRERGCLLSEWSLRTCVARAGYAAAVVLKSRNFSIRAFTVLDVTLLRDRTPDPCNSSDHLIFPCSHARRPMGMTTRGT